MLLRNQRSSQCKMLALCPFPVSRYAENQLTLVLQDFFSFSNLERPEEERNKRFHTFLHAFLWWLLNHTHSIDSLGDALAFGDLWSAMWACLTCRLPKTGFSSLTKSACSIEDEINKKNYSNKSLENWSLLICHGTYFDRVRPSIICEIASDEIFTFSLCRFCRKISIERRVVRRERSGI